MKLFEKLIFNNLNSHITQNNRIPDSQYGFCTGLSTQNQLIDLIYDISMSFNDPKILCVDIIFLDYSNAFDNVSFGLMLEKLYSLGITGESLAIILSLLYGRNFHVTLKAVVFVLFAIKSGVPQGGVISAIVFNISVRNLPFIIN